MFQHFCQLLEKFYGLNLCYTGRYCCLEYIYVKKWILKKMVITPFCRGRAVYLKARSVLETWRKQEGSKASRQAILDALENCKNKDAKEKLQTQWGKAEKIYEKFDSLNVYDLIMLQRLISSSCV